MSNHIQWVVAMSARPEKVDRAQQLVETIAIATRTARPGALILENCPLGGTSQSALNERYAGNDSTMVHLQNFQGTFANDVSETFEPALFPAVCPVNHEVKTDLMAMGTTFDTKIGGYMH